jgi:hypothetical protein
MTRGIFAPPVPAPGDGGGTVTETPGTDFRLEMSMTVEVTTLSPCKLTPTLSYFDILRIQWTEVSRKMAGKEVVLPGLQRDSLKRSSRRRNIESLK